MNVKTFKPVTKKFSINNSYWKNKPSDAPANPFEAFMYASQFADLPYDTSEKWGTDVDGDWLYECFTSYQKRFGVYNSQFFTPRKTADRMAELMVEYLDTFTMSGMDYHDLKILDACAGFGQLGNAIYRELSLDSPMLTYFEADSDMHWLLKQNTPTESVFRSTIEEFKGDQLYHGVISNPPYETPEMTHFYEGLNRWLMVGGIAVLLLPQGYIDKTKPIKFKSLLQSFNIVYRTPMKEDFALTKIKAEIVVLQKAN